MVHRAALIGCGAIGTEYDQDRLAKGISSHAGAYDTCKKTELVAVCDSDYSKAEQTAQRWNVPVSFTDARKMLNEIRPQIVSICTPNATHGELLDLVLNTPEIKAVLIEKPLALNKEYALDLAKLAEKKRIVLAVNYSRRYSTGHQTIKTQIREEVIGQIQSVSGFYTKGIYHNGTHWIDLARWFFGEVREARGFNLRNHEDEDCQLDAFFIFKNGASGFLQALDNKHYSLFEMDILGTQGRFRISESGHRVERFEVANSTHYSGYTTLKLLGGTKVNMENLTLNAVDDLVKSMETGVSPLCSAKDGVRAIEIASQLSDPIQISPLVSTIKLELGV